jgi:hypothetical protein
MLNTEFKIKNLEEWITTMIDFDNKLKEFDKRQGTQSEIENYICDGYFMVKIKIQDK